jgi:two-component system, NarL family, nitrate/nitrite response regulator NarL
MRNRFATIVVEPSIFIREGLLRVLGAAQFRIIASADRVEDLVLASLPQHRSILLVIGTGEKPRAAVRQIELFREWHPAGRIAVLGRGWDLSDTVSVFRIGANACLVKVGACDILVKTLELVMLGETILPSAMLLPYILDNSNTSIEPQLTANAGVLTHIDGNDTPHLSVREKCVLYYLVEGHSNKLIARKINVAEATVKVHVKAIFRKIQVLNRTQAAMWALNHSSIISTIDGASQDRRALRPARSFERNGGPTR